MPTRTVQFKQESPLSCEDTALLSSKRHPRDRVQERETKKSEIAQPSAREGRARLSVKASSLTVDIILGCVVVSTLHDSVRSTIDLETLLYFAIFEFFRSCLESCLVFVTRRARSESKGFRI